MVSKINTLMCGIPFQFDDKVMNPIIAALSDDFSTFYLNKGVISRVWTLGFCISNESYVSDLDDIRVQNILLVRQNEITNDK